MTSINKLLIFLSVLFGFPCFSQDSLNTISTKPRPKNNVYIELAGKSSFYSLNYERYFSNNRELKISGRVGFSYFGNNDLDQISLPYGLNLALGKNKGHFEMGVNQMIVYNSEVYNSNQFQGIGSTGFGYNNQASYVRNRLFLANGLSFGYKLIPLKNGFTIGAYANFWLPTIILSNSDKSRYGNYVYIIGTTINYYNIITPSIGFNFGYIF